MPAEVEDAGASPEVEQGVLEPLQAEIEEAGAGREVEQGALQLLPAETAEAGAGPKVEQGGLGPCKVRLKRQGQVIVKGAL